MADDLRRPVFSISLTEAMSRRPRRNYFLLAPSSGSLSGEQPIAELLSFESDARDHSPARNSMRLGRGPLFLL
jgi:hypothetical protein